MRSWLLIPAGNAARLARAASLAADVMVIDFHADGGETPADVRAQAAAWIATQRGHPNRFARWVRIKPVTAPQWREDLAAVMSARPDGVILADAASPDEVRQLGSELYELEQQNGIAPNSVPMVLELGASARGAMAIGGMVRDPNPRVCGMTWNPAMLARDIGAVGSAGKVGWAAPLAQVRAQTVLAAHTLGGLAVEAPFTAWRDSDAFARACAFARRDGFDAMMAVHPSQLEAINQRFTPSEDARAEAANIVAMFEASPSANMLPLAGRMIGREHLAFARRILSDF